VRADLSREPGSRARHMRAPAAPSSNSLVSAFRARPSGRATRMPRQGPCSRSLRALRSVRPDGIRVNASARGRSDALTADIVTAGIRARGARPSAGCASEPEDIARCALFLASDDARYLGAASSPTAARWRAADWEMGAPIWPKPQTFGRPGGPWRLLLSRRELRGPRWPPNPQMFGAPRRAVALLYRAELRPEMAPQPPNFGGPGSPWRSSNRAEYGPRDGPPNPSVRSARRSRGLLYRGGNYAARDGPQTPSVRSAPASGALLYRGGITRPEWPPTPHTSERPGGAVAVLYALELRGHRDAPNPPKCSERPAGRGAPLSRRELRGPEMAPKPPSVRSAPAEPWRSSIAGNYAPRDGPPNRL